LAPGKRRPRVIRSQAAPVVIAALSLFALTRSGVAAPTDPFSGGQPTYDKDAPKSAATTSGEYGVDATHGAVTYTFPIVVPPGRKGLEPSLSLNYSSQGTLRGGVAAGWTLNGIPSIELDPSGGA